MVGATIKNWKTFQALREGEQFLIPGEHLRYRKRSEGTYHPTYWETLEEDPDIPLECLNPLLLVQSLGSVPRAAIASKW